MPKINKHFKCQSHAYFKRILKYCCFGKTHIFASTVMELFECFLLLVREGLFEILVMPCHITEQFLHLLGVGSAVLLRNDVSVPQLVDYIFHRLHLLLAQQHTTEESISPALFRKQIQLFSPGLFIVYCGANFGDRKHKEKCNTDFSSMLHFSYLATLNRLFLLDLT